MSSAGEYEILKYHDGSFSRESDPVVEERLAEIYVNGRPYVSVMATPGQLDYLAVGCLFTEGLIEKASDIKSIAVDTMRVRVEVDKAVAGPPPRARSSGFGLGSVAVGGLSGSTLSQAKAPKLTAERIIELMETFNRRSDLFRKTGAVHSACLVSGGREYFSEDVGRHNALDKVIGQYLMDSRPPTGEPGLMLTTGRISTEILLKSAKAGLGAVISRSAATDRAVELARKLNMIMIGFSRQNRFNVYSGEDMIPQDGYALNACARCR